MALDGIGSSVIIALAAALWLLYLVPTWLRRREYLSTERNALRLQQTLRILAESAEVPEAVRVESSARAAVQQERVLRKLQHRELAMAKQQDAQLARQAARRLAETRPAVAAEASTHSVAARRLRRSRVVTTVLLLAAVVAVIAGFGELVASGAWLLLAAGAVVGTGSIMMLAQMASVGRARAALAHEVRSTPPVRVRVEQPVRQAVQQREWTPVPIPKPLYSRPQADRSVAASLEAAAELRQAAAESERRMREAEKSREVTPIRPAAASRFASMGIVDRPEAAMTDLDAVLKRRRAAG